MATPENTSHFLTSRLRGTIGPKLVDISLETQKPCSKEEFLSWIRNNKDQTKSTCYFLDRLVELRLGERFSLPHVSGPIVESPYFSSNSQIGIVDMDGPREAFVAKEDINKTAENMHNKLYSVNYYLIDIQVRKN